MRKVNLTGSALRIWAATAFLTLIVSPRLFAQGKANVSSQSAPAIKETTSLRLLFCGDYMLHRGVKRTAMYHRRVGGQGTTLNNKGFDVPIRPLRSLTAKADLSFCNLECPIVHPTKGDTYCFKTAGAFWFKAPAAAARALHSAGFRVASIANNHMDNAGPEGVKSTVEIMQKIGIAPVGGGKTFDEAHKPVVVTVQGLPIAFLAYCSSKLGRDINTAKAEEPHVCRTNPLKDDNEQLWKDLKAAKKRAKLVVLSFHWGPKEYEYQPDERIISFARRCARAGADIIVGHHPHVLHKMERYDSPDGRRCLIMYSLGNLVSNQSPKYHADSVTRDEDKARRREGAAVFVTVDKKQVCIKAVTVSPLWTDNNYFDYLTGREPARVRVVAIDDEIARLNRRLTFLKERKIRIDKALRGTLPDKRPTFAASRLPSYAASANAEKGERATEPLPGPP